MKMQKIYCSICKIKTNQDIIASKNTNGYNEEAGIQWWEDFQIIQCKGCDTISFRKTFESSEDFDPVSGKTIVNSEQYPTGEFQREMMADYFKFPPRIRKIYRETIDALNNKLLLLTSIGLRMLIEAICLDKEIKGSNLATKITELANKGLLSQIQADFLHQHRFIGNDAAHKIKAPKPESLVAAIEIAETLLKAIYILPDIVLKIET
ncbi:MAG: hypothetical protein SCALA702_02440 [Melioribacteraceae bacterium]|nr:MAG: hypothetical protein SCALA702_02440 [Melioribacteraceae bacterium]